MRVASGINFTSPSIQPLLSLFSSLHLASVCRSFHSQLHNVHFMIQCILFSRPNSALSSSVQHSVWGMRSMISGTNCSSHEINRIASFQRLTLAGASRKCWMMVMATVKVVMVGMLMTALHFATFSWRPARDGSTSTSRKWLRQFQFQLHPNRDGWAIA